MTKVVLIDGPYSGAKVDLNLQPRRIRVGRAVYERLDDPETDESLDGYLYLEEDER